MEACATSHYWAREIAALGHEVRLMPPRYVKPYVKRNKNDAADAQAICEAVTRPTMRFASVKNMEQQSVLLLHRTRDLLVRQHTMLINAIRAHMAELGIVAPVAALTGQDGSRESDSADQAAEKARLCEERQLLCGQDGRSPSMVTRCM